VPRLALEWAGYSSGVFRRPQVAPVDNTWQHPEFRSATCCIADRVRLAPRSSCASRTPAGDMMDVEEAMVTPHRLSGCCGPPF
jgi:hypothetical protein